jgi:hypothetical protein
VLKELREIRCISNLLRIEQDLVELSRLGETSNNFVWDVRTEVDAEC